MATAKRPPHPKLPSVPPFPTITIFGYMAVICALLVGFVIGGLLEKREYAAELLAVETKASTYEQNYNACVALYDACVAASTKRCPSAYWSAC